MLDEPNQGVSPTTKNVRIGWWNTHLTPPKGNSLPHSEHGLVLEVIILLLTKCDVLYLGEVSTKDLDWLASQLSGTPFLVKDMTTAGKSKKFNLGVIFNENVASFVESEFNIDTITGNRYKISCRIDFIFHHEAYFSFLVSHWPSRLHKSGDSEIRGHFGSALRKSVEGILDNVTKYVVVLGDFNDEPFTHSMTNYLRACRDAPFVSLHPDLLYNPFWKQISCSKGYVNSSDQADPTGTYFYRGDNLHRWRVFDQMLFCSAFVGLSEWHLNEAETGVFRYEPLVRAVEASWSKLDHLPIVAELNKEPANG